MRRPATRRRVPPAPTGEDFFNRLATDALTSVMTDLRRRVEHSGTERSVAQVLLAEAHVAEAVGLLRAIQHTPSECELAPPGPLLRAAPYARSRAQRPRRPDQLHGRAS
jgi:hypothetical protein